jgi:hypothetical protein
VKKLVSIDEIEIWEVKFRLKFFVYIDDLKFFEVECVLKIKKTEKYIQ